MSKDNPAIEANEKYKKEVLRSLNNKQEELKSNKPQKLSEFENKWNMNNKIIELFANNIEKDQELKQKYSSILITILAIQLLALLIIFILKGVGVLSYSDSTFNIFVSGGIAEVFVLVRIIVKYLFKDNLTNALNIILENNNQIKRNKTNKNSKSKITYKKN